MKYINKKLPLLKVGEEFKYTNQDVTGVHCFDSGTLHCNESTLKTLISEGWIEPIKPREWWVIINESSKYCSERYDSYEEAEQKRLLYTGKEDYKVIKVREVIQ